MFIQFNNDPTMSEYVVQNNDRRRILILLDTYLILQD